MLKAVLADVQRNAPVSLREEMPARQPALRAKRALMKLMPNLGGTTALSSLRTASPFLFTDNREKITDNSVCYLLSILYSLF